MTSAVADFAVEADLDGDAAGRYRATGPARLGRGDVTVVVQVLPWVDQASWDTLVPLLEAIHAAGVGDEHLVDLLEAGFLDGDGAWCVTADPGCVALADGPVDTVTALRAVAGAARAAHTLHEAGVVHRGVRPDAIHIDGSLGLPLIDEARITESRVLAFGVPAGLDTVDPALARGGRPSRETDLFALGAVLQRACSGRLLHPDLVSDQPVIALQRVTFEPVQLAPDLPAAIAAVVAACTAPDPADRPPTALALAQHLELLAAQT